MFAHPAVEHDGGDVSVAALSLNLMKGGKNHPLFTGEAIAGIRQPVERSPRHLAALATLEANLARHRFPEKIALPVVPWHTLSLPRKTPKPDQRPLSISAA